MKVSINNKKAHFDYKIENDVEAGMVLNGHQVKSIYGGSFSINGGYVRFVDGVLVLSNCNIGTEQQNLLILLKKSEIRKIKKFLDIQGNTIVPLQIYNGRSKFLKVKLGFATGRKKVDKREYIKEKDIQRDLNY